MRRCPQPSRHTRQPEFGIKNQPRGRVPCGRTRPLRPAAAKLTKRKSLRRERDSNRLISVRRASPFGSTLSRPWSVLPREKKLLRARGTESAKHIDQSVCALQRRRWASHGLAGGAGRLRTAGRRKTVALFRTAFFHPSGRQNRVETRYSARKGTGPARP